MRTRLPDAFAAWLRERTGGGGRARARTCATVLAVLVALPLLPVDTARLLGGHPPVPWPQLAALVLPAVTGGVAALAVLVPLRRWRPAAAVALLLAPALAWQTPSLVPDGGQGAAASALGSGGAGVTPLRVATVNCRLGEADPAAIVREVRRRHIDVLATQELSERLVRRLRAAGLGSLLPQQRLLPAAGGAGTGIWSRFPLQPEPALDDMAFWAPRAVLTLPSGRRVELLAVHPISPRPQTEGLWRADLARVARAVRSAGPAVVVLGDFNASRDHAGFRRILDAGVVDAADQVGAAAWPGLTWPAGGPVPPFVRLDHVLVSPALVHARRVRTIPVPGSDHRGVVADLEIAP